jgi:hypothetical protein
MVDIDEQTKFFCEIPSSNPETFDISNYTIMKIEAIIDCSFNQIVDLLSQPEKYKLFNPHVNDYHTLCEFDGSCVYYLSLKAFSAWYFPRDYILINYKLHTPTCLYIIEKSINHSDAPKSLVNVLSDVHLRISIYQPNKNNKVMVKEIYVVNYGGYAMTQNQC